MMKSIGIVIGGIIIITVIGFVAGPRLEFRKLNPVITPLNVSINDIDNYVNQKEAEIAGLKMDNEARIIWADSTHSRTPYSVVYLHGFSASQEEGDPLHESFAGRYGFNLFLSRLAGHGLQDSSSFESLTPYELVESAKEAISIGSILGEKVIVMSCSTGGTLSAYLAAYNPEIIHSQFMYSPNIDIKDPLSEMLTLPWGYEIARMSFGGDRNLISYSPQRRQYWNDAYHIKGLIAVKALIEETMYGKTFRKIQQPLFLGYYYKDDENQDEVVSVDRMLDFFEEVGTAENMKVRKAFPDAGRHVITSYLASEDIEGVMQSTFRFAEEVLGLEPKVQDH